MALIDHFLPPLAFAAMLASEENLANTSFDTARADMDRLLDQAVERAGEETHARADDALFAVCAFADEVILDSSWPGRDQWITHKLQASRFNTANAGLEFFERLENLCTGMAPNETGKTESDDEALGSNERQREALEVYVACLTLGFRGKYNDDREAVDQLADDNLERLLADSGLSKEKVFPEAYAAALPPPEPSGLPPAVKNLILFGGPLLLAVTIYATYSAILSAFVRNWLGAL